MCQFIDERCSIYSRSGTPVELETVLPDLSGIKQIQDGELSIQTKIGEVAKIYIVLYKNIIQQGGFGSVYKGTVQTMDGIFEAAIKEVKMQEEIDVSKFYDFQHEVVIMRFEHFVKNREGFC